MVEDHFGLLEMRADGTGNHIAKKETRKRGRPRRPTVERPSQSPPVKLTQFDPRSCTVVPGLLGGGVGLSAVWTQQWEPSNPKCLHLGLFGSLTDHMGICFSTVSICATVTRVPGCLGQPASYRMVRMPCRPVQVENSLPAETRRRRLCKPVYPTRRVWTLQQLCDGGRRATVRGTDIGPRSKSETSRRPPGIPRNNRIGNGPMRVESG
ncbi:uncharacterized protein B0H64DRAFT_452816 [Chaetomium fimeti]|uniref:Uncharacterized protein n=1 Tax=Chaetomium fimeti TaxID=1854472 RepID=A0AAE0LML6_9PEZI|nr:hypothetical protein B0H64DRAFT_452816 [Chaetomium fimeti]